VKEECLAKLVLFGEALLRRALAEYAEHFHVERNHQGKGNVLLFSGHRQSLWQRQRPCALPGATGRPAEVLPPRGRLNLWAIRQFFGKKVIQIRRLLGAVCSGSVCSPGVSFVLCPRANASSA